MCGCKEVINDREKDIHGVYDILFSRREVPVVVLEHYVQAITEQKTEQNEK